MTTYATKGTCSREIQVELDGTKIKEVKVIGGCNGNLNGISSLLRGMDTDEAIARMKGTLCGSKSTSCPDQIAIALELAKQEQLA